MSEARLIIVGAGGHGSVVGEVALAIGRWREIVYLDEFTTLPSVAGRWSVVSSLDRLALSKGGWEGVVAIGDSSDRERWVDNLESSGVSVVSLVDPSARVSPSATIGIGAVVLPGAIVNAQAEVEAGAILNSGSIVEHHCRVGAYAHICPGAVLGGAATVGAHTWIGLGACLRDKVNVGSHCVVGMGSVVVADVADGMRVLGVPARAQ